MRVLHAPNNIAGLSNILASAERNLGIESFSYSIHRSLFNYQTDFEVDEKSNRILRVMLNAIMLGFKFDVFLFYFGESLLGPYLWDVPILKKLGKKIFFYFHGCDLRDSKKIIESKRRSACDICWPQLCSPNRMRAVRIAKAYADVVFVSTPDLLEFYEGSVFLPQPIDTGGFRDLRSIRQDYEYDQDSFTVVHAPSNRVIKGTRYIEEAVAELRSKGYPVILKIIENMTHEEAMSICLKADVAVDQMLIGAYGVFAIEMMMLGKPVVCYIRDDLKRYYGKDLPIINATPENLVVILEDLYHRSNNLKDLGKAGSEYVLKHHDAMRIAQKTIEYYDRSARMRLGAKT